MGDVSKSRYSGLLIPDPRIDVEAVWAAESSYTQASPRPGVPEPASGTVTRLALATTGTQSAGGAIELRTQRGGFPAPDEAGFIWRAPTDAQWMGWDPPQAIQAWDPAVWTDGSGALAYVRNPHAIALADGTVLVAVQTEDTTYSGTTGRYRLEIVTRHPTAHTWARSLVMGTDTAPQQPFCPTLVLMPNGRILLYYIREGDLLANVSMYYSDDSGATWAFGGVGITDGPLLVTSSAGDVDIVRMRAAYRSGQVLLLVGARRNSTAPRDRVVQYASDDGGNSFSQVETHADATYNIGGFDVVGHPDAFVISIIGPSSTPYARILRSGDAFRALSTLTAITGGSAGLSTGVAAAEVASNAFARADSALVYDEDGTLYHYVLFDEGSRMVGFVSASVDGGSTWDGVGMANGYTTPSSAGGFWWNMGDDGDYPVNFCAVPWQGRVLVIGPWAAAPGNEDESLGCWHLGGYTTLTQPPIRRTSSQFRRAGWESTWNPTELPEDCGWALTGAATRTLSSPGRLNISATTVQTGYVDRNPTGTITEGASVQFGALITSGGDWSTNRIACRVRLADGVNDYTIDIRMQTSGYRVYNGNTGTQIGSDQALDFTTGAEIRVEMVNDDVRVFHRARTAAIAPTKTWTAGPTSSAVTTGGMPAANNLVSWGVRATGAAAANVDWYDFHDGFDELSGGKILAVGYTNPTDLHPRSYSVDPVYVTDGVRLLATGGPTYIGDAWTIATRYDHELRRALEDHSPRRTWRSTSTGQQVISLSIREGLATDDWAMGSLLGIYLGNTNIAQVTLSGYDQDTTSWVSLGTASLVNGLTSLRWTRGATAVRPDASTPSSSLPYLHEQEFRGATFRLDATHARRVTDQREGAWRTLPSQRVRPVVVLAGVTGAEASSGTGGAIIPKNACILLDLVGTRYSAIRITVPQGASQPAQPAEGYFEIGVLKVGYVVPFGQDYAWGRVISTEHATEIRESEDRTKSSRVLAPVRRVVEIGWPDGLDESEASADAADPDFQTASLDANAEPVSVPETTIRVLEGHMQALDGPHIPVVYLQRFDRASGVRTLNRRDDMVYGRLEAESLRREVVLGEEGIDELVRGSTVQIVEEV